MSRNKEEEREKRCGRCVTPTTIPLRLLWLGKHVCLVDDEEKCLCTQFSRLIDRR